jgi:5-methylcytosine-specific restriction endonuclease McrA
MMNITTRAEAKVSGAKRFFSGESCKNGHFAERTTKDNYCCECKRQTWLAKSQAKNPSLCSHREASANRKAALANGCVTYVGGVCKANPSHGGKRYTGGGGCVGCADEISASDKKKEYDKIYNLENRDHILARVRSYNERTKEKRSVQAKEWARKNPEKRRAISSSYKARRRSKERNGDPTSVIFAWEQNAGKVCFWCKRECAEKYHVDHIFPLSKGGQHIVTNLAISCPSCNLSKSAKHPAEFARSIDRHDIAEKFKEQ